MVKVSIIIPTKNNIDVIEKCLTSLQNIDFPQDEFEIIIVDGHSTDGTVEIAKKYGCKVFLENAGTIGYARDLGVKYASGSFVAFTDADCVCDRNWINELIRLFNGEKVAAVGGPNITPGDDTEFGKCVGNVLLFLSKLGARYGFKEEKITKVYHNPTCNVMYKKSVLEEVGGFNYRLITVDDEELDYRIRKMGYVLLYTPYAVVYHYRRSSWSKFARMAWNYGVGRMQAIKLHRNMGKWYYYTPSVLIFINISLLFFFCANFIFPTIALLMFLLGGLGIGIVSLHLATKDRKTKIFLTYYGLLVIWFWGYGLGMFRGLVK